MQAALATLRADARAPQPAPDRLRSEIIDAQWGHRDELDAAQAMPGGTRLRYGGYIELDAIASHTAEGSPPGDGRHLFYTRAYHSIHANLLYSAAPRLLFGGELMVAGRELQDGRNGDMMRLQMAVK